MVLSLILSFFWLQGDPFVRPIRVDVPPHRLLHPGWIRGPWSQRVRKIYPDHLESEHGRR